MAKKRRKKKRRKAQERLIQPPELPSSKEKLKEKIPKKRKPYLTFSVILLLLIAALFVARLFLFPGKVRKDSRLNVLLVTLDTTRPDRLGCYGYEKAKTPRLDSLASKGVRFLNVYCQVPLTTPSHCSILTGTYPIYHLVRNNGAYALRSEITTLAEVLKGKGFETAAFVGSFTVDSRFGLDQGFDVYDDRFAEAQAFKALNSERKAEKVFEAFSRWFDKNHAAQFFCWVHFYDPHLPYEPPSPYKEEFADNPYDGEIACMDHYVGEVVEKLREKNILANTIIILAGDHGEAFGEKVEAGHGIFLYEGTMKVPLIFYAESHLPQGLTVKPRVRLIDLMPTVLDMLNIPANKDIQGVSLLPFIAGKKKENLSTYIETYFPRENYGWSELVGFIGGDWKYIRAPKEELYNLKKDPEETRNAIAEEKKIAQEMRAKLDEIIARNSSVLQSTKREMTGEEKEKLRSLGYISHSESVPSGPLPDPKDRIEELRLVQQAETFDLEGNFAEAAGIYEKILSLRPQTPVSYVNVALMQAKMGHFEDAIRTLQQGTEKIPKSELLLTRLGHTYMVTGRLKKALEAMQAVLEVNPRSFDALLASAWILNFMGQKEEARGYFEKALAVEPENKFLRKNYAMNLATSGKIQEAIDIFKILVSDYPDDYEIWQDLGIAYGYAGKISDSIDSLKKAVSLHPTPMGYYNLAVAFKKVGKIQEAVDYLKLYLENTEGEDESQVNSARQELINLEKFLRQK
jgi:arylsulfatase A-like enzyme/Tfp pilus assembly protein PilF